MSQLRRPIAVLAVFILSGCTAGLVSVTSGQIGCPEKDITVTDHSSGWNTVTWTAECRGKRYFCSSHSGSGEGSTAQVACKEDTATATAALAPGSGSPSQSPAAAGCQYDTQCKGDRVCVEGACVEASQPQ